MPDQDTRERPSHTVAFDWDLAEFADLVRACEVDDTVQLALRYLPKPGRILEAGCGPGHVVRYLQDRGYEIDGLEINAAIVDGVAARFPDLPIKAGDVAQVPVSDGHYDGLLSFGVVEHFIGGMRAPLAEHFRVLRPGGIAIVSVPSQNLLRRLKTAARRVRRSLRGKVQPSPAPRVAGGPEYVTFPSEGPFFEYRLTPAQFKAEVGGVGFELLASLPTHHTVGLSYEFHHWCVRQSGRRFSLTASGRIVDALLGLRPFVHNHMHTIVARKPLVARP